MLSAGLAIASSAAQAGVEVAGSAPSGEDALEMQRNESADLVLPGLVLLDPRMPGIFKSESLPVYPDDGAMLEVGGSGES